MPGKDPPVWATLPMRCTSVIVDEHAPSVLLKTSFGGNSINQREILSPYTSISEDVVTFGVSKCLEMVSDVLSSGFW